jgi:hypothetical protein
LFGHHGIEDTQQVQIQGQKAHDSEVESNNRK